MTALAPSLARSTDRRGRAPTWPLSTRRRTRPSPIPHVPVVQVTGTNGKTTTVRLLAHLVRSAGKTVAYSSTDGVFRDDGALVEAGDYSGFGGAARALAQEPDVAVLETARGGMLLRGIGVRHNDVAVVTNVSEDHLGLHGVDTVDQLAEVKSVDHRASRARTDGTSSTPTIRECWRCDVTRPAVHGSSRSIPTIRRSARRSPTAVGA